VLVNKEVLRNLGCFAKQSENYTASEIEKIQQDCQNLFDSVSKNRSVIENPIDIQGYHLAMDLITCHDPRFKPLHHLIHNLPKIQLHNGDSILLTRKDLEDNQLLSSLSKSSSSASAIAEDSNIISLADFETDELRIYFEFTNTFTFSTPLPPIAELLSICKIAHYLGNTSILQNINNRLFPLNPNDPYPHIITAQQGIKDLAFPLPQIKAGDGELVFLTTKDLEGNRYLRSAFENMLSHPSTSTEEEEHIFPIEKFNSTELKSYFSFSNNFTPSTALPSITQLVSICEISDFLENNSLLKSLDNLLNDYFENKIHKRDFVLSEIKDNPSLDCSRISEIVNLLKISNYLQNSHFIDYLKNNICEHTIISTINEFKEKLNLTRQDIIEGLLYLLNDRIDLKGKDLLEGFLVAAAIESSEGLSLVDKYQNLSDILGNKIETLFFSSTPSQEELEAISRMFPNIRSFYLQDSSATILPKLPEIWKGNLEKFTLLGSKKLEDVSALNDCKNLKKLDLAGSGVTILPSGCTALKVCDISRSNITDTTALDNSLYLTTFKAAGCKIANLPSRCPSLKICDISYCKKLADTSALKNSANLEKLIATGSSIITIPSGCINLRICNISHCKNLRDSSSLNNSRYLEEFTAVESNITSLPFGCVLLRICDISNCNIKDPSPLNNSLHLEEFIANDSRLENLPLGCSSLQICDIANCPNIQDSAPLNNCSQLKIFLASNSSIQTIPEGCSALERCDISDCINIEETTPLNNLIQLKEFLASDSSIRNIPSGCTALEICIISNCSNIEDTSPLNNCSQLKTFLAADSSIKNIPSGCTALQTCDVHGCDNLTDCSALSNSPHLKTFIATNSGF